MKYMHNHINI